MEFTVKQYIAALEKRQKEVKDAKNIFKPASTVHAEMTERIFISGLNCTNSPHGSYSTDPLYINTSLKSPRRLPPEGKTGKTVFGDGSPHKTTYFKGGYKEFKGRIKNNTKVNFQVFGDLRNDFANSLQRRGSQYISGVKRDINGKKIEGLVDKYGVCSFRFTQQEKDLYLELLGKRLNKIMRGDA